MRIDSLLQSQAQQRPDEPVAVHLGETLSYEQLESHSARCAAVLRDCGIGRGERVALVLENGLAYMIAYFGILRAGAVVVGINPANTPRGIRFILDDCAVSALICQQKSLRAAREALVGVASVTHLLVSGVNSPEIDDIPGIKTLRFETALQQVQETVKQIRRREDELACIIYTSGTTGDPKGVMLTHRNLYSNTKSINEYLKLVSTDSVMVVLPFYYSYGQSLMLTHVAVGGKLVIDNRFAYPNKILDIMEQEEVTGFSGVPSTFAILVHKSAIRKRTLPALRYLTQAGGPMSPQLAMELREILPHAAIFIMYGQTEAAARLSFLHPDRLQQKLGSIGKSIPGVELRILNRRGKPVKPGEVGEIVARGENLMAGYWGDPDGSARVLCEEGLRTGDLARVDEEGFIYIVSRKSDMIKSGAHRISPIEIENILCEHAAVFESVVVGVPDQLMGEVIIAMVALCENTEVDEAELIAHCRKNLPLYKLPRRVIIQPGIPKTQSGKVRRGEVRDMVSNLIQSTGTGDEAEGNSVAEPAQE